MNTLSLRECDKLDGASNFICWKFKLQMPLEEVWIWEHVVKGIPAPTNPRLLAIHVKREAKEKRIIFYLVKDHLKLSRNLYLPKAKGKWILNWRNKEDDLSLSP
jgi:hypothetical protein